MGEKCGWGGGEKQATSGQPFPSEHFIYPGLNRWRYAWIARGERDKPNDGTYLEVSVVCDHLDEISFPITISRLVQSEPKVSYG